MTECEKCHNEILQEQNTVEKFARSTTHSSCWDEYKKRVSEHRCAFCNEHLSNDDHITCGRDECPTEYTGYPGT